MVIATVSTIFLIIIFFKEVDSMLSLDLVFKNPEKAVTFL